MAHGIIPRPPPKPDTTLSQPLQTDRSSSIASTRAPSALPESDAPASHPNLFLRPDTVDIDDATPIDLTQDEDNKANVFMKRSGSVMSHLNAVNLLQEQLRQAKDSLITSRRAMEDVKPRPAFNVGDFFRQGEVIDLTDL